MPAPIVIIERDEVHVVIRGDRSPVVKRIPVVGKLDGDFFSFHILIVFLIYYKNRAKTKKTYPISAHFYIEADVLEHIGYEIVYFECSLEAKVFCHSVFPHLLNGAVLELTDTLW